MPIKIITDSTANITADQIDGIEHITVPVSYTHLTLPTKA